ncbi:diguanylate cyclase [Mangrovibacter plantisponsor]|uniref:diguanylate cyclase n=1 Tax=Mangrovibacter plantisponsor TaxID=451513 RepID=A0A317PUM1_9ENTR|nr:diguanylate cyclase [Mangrovibacter plantisponsor]PWW05963.1 diguanylate cyclase (GGDEF)-like protein [Mangrovibacter plantisponsor]
MQMILNIDNDLIALNQAIKNHYEWAGKLLELALLGGKTDEAILHPLAHQRCQFSRWISHNLEEGHPGAELVSRIYYAHVIMHDRARDLMQAIMNTAVSPVILSNYHHAQQLFINSIDKYKEYLFESRNHMDTLTGLPLRHLLYSNFALMQARNQRAGKRIFVLLMDIDRFKSINDCWGHNAGDEVLRRVADILCSGARRHEPVYRFGGEEFIMLIEASSGKEACQCAARLCHHLESNPVELGAELLTVTVTGGIVGLKEGESLHDAIGRADKAMYHGKNTGRNRCIYMSETGQLMTLTHQVPGESPGLDPGANTNAEFSHHP